MDIWKPVAGALLMAVAGCGTPSVRKSTRPTDWESPEFAAHQQLAHAPAPSPTPPATAPPRHLPPDHKYEMSWLPLEGWCEHNQHAMPVRLSGTTVGWSLNATNGSFIL